MSKMETDSALIVPDLLFGAESIADALGMTRRQIYHAVASRYLPAFRIGGTICARRTTLERWLNEREEDHAQLGIVQKTDGESLRLP